VCNVRYAEVPQPNVSCPRDCHCPSSYFVGASVHANALDSNILAFVTDTGRLAYRVLPLSFQVLPAETPLHRDGDL